MAPKQKTNTRGNGAAKAKAASNRRRAPVRSRPAGGMPSARTVALKSQNNIPINTPSSILNQLANRTAAMRIDHVMSPYVMCRRDPFCGKGSVPIPDGNNSNFFVSDFISLDLITSGGLGSGFIIQTVPWLPCTALFTNLIGSSCRINGAVATAAAVVDPIDGANLTSAWAACGIVPPYIGPTYFPGSVVLDPFTATSARIVSMAYRLVYTGSAINASGNLSVSANNLTLSPQTLPTTANTGAPAVNTWSLRINDNSQGANAFAAISTPVYNLDGGIKIASLNRDNVDIFPAAGMFAISKHRTGDYKVLPLSATACGVSGRLPAASLLGNQQLSPMMNFNGFSGGITFVDNDWSGVQIIASGLAADAAFRFEVATCIEYNPQAGTVLASTAKSEAPENRAALAAAKRITEAMPSAMPFAAGPSQQGRNF